MPALNHIRYEPMDVSHGMHTGLVFQKLRGNEYEGHLDTTG